LCHQILKRAESFDELSALFTFGAYAPKQGEMMIWRVAVDLKEILIQGRNYSWPRPDHCLRCRNWCVWGHGYVYRYFDGFIDALLMKCYRCPGCGCVITLRPDSHFSRIHSSRKIIHFHLSDRLTHGLWPASSLPHPRLRHWLKNLRRQVQVYLTNHWGDGLLAGFEELLRRNLIPVARVNQSVNPPTIAAPQ